MPQPSKHGEPLAHRTQRSAGGRAGGRLLRGQSFQLDVGVGRLRCTKQNRTWILSPANMSDGLFKFMLFTRGETLRPLVHSPHDKTPGKECIIYLNPLTGRLVLCEVDVWLDLQKHPRIIFTQYHSKEMRVTQFHSKKLEL